MEIEIIEWRIIIVDGKEYTLRVPAGTEVDEEEFAQTIRRNIKIAEERAKKQSK